MKRQLLILICATGAAAQPRMPAEIRGSVVDARGGEALANVEILLAGSAYRTNSDAAGRFRLAGIAPGDYVLNASTVGYHLVKRSFHLDAGEVKEFEVILASDTFRQTESVEGKAGPFETIREDSPSVLVLAGNDAKNLGSVLADDPLRAVQGLPGVSSNNDFDARFSLRGADFSRIGVYFDGILLHEPFHTIQSQSVAASATAFNGDMVEELELHEGAFPARFADRTAGVLDVHTREGNRTATTVRASASASNAGVMVEGPLGGRKRGSWMAGARKSYLQYILARTFPDSSLVFGLEDAQGKAVYDLTSKSTISLYVLESYSSLDRSRSRDRLGINSLMLAGYHSTFGNLGWRYTPAVDLLVTANAAWMREKFDDSNPGGLPLGGGYYGEWVGNAAVTWIWNRRSPLDAGWSVRRIRDGGFLNQYLPGGGQSRVRDRFDGTATRSGGYVEQSWLAGEGRLHFSAGARWDHHSLTGTSAVSPQASAAFTVAPSTRVQIGWGQYAQFQELTVLASPLGGRQLLPARANHVLAAVEQRIGARARLRVEFYNRADRDLTFQPEYDPRLTARGVFVPPLNPRYVNSLRGYSRGFEFFVQRSSANRFTGWISYAFGRTGMRDGATGQRFPSDWDQRHTVNIYGGYRVSPTVNLSLRCSYGSGFPIPGYFRRSGTTYYLDSSRNQVRLPAYQRTDFRMNKAWTRDRFKVTLYGEIINITNRSNYIFDSLGGYNGKTGQTSVRLDKLFPILPSVGIVVER